MPTRGANILMWQTPIVAILAALSLALAAGEVVANDDADLPRFAAAEMTGAGDGDGASKNSGGDMVLPTQTPLAEPTPGEQYCTSVQDQAALAQLALQKKELETAQVEIDKRIKVLTEKSNEYKDWLAKREDFLKRATESLVGIYAQMKPEAAAARLTAMNELVAAAIISKLAPKSAGAVLSEMETSKAARLSSVLAGAAEVVATSAAQARERP